MLSKLFLSRLVAVCIITSRSALFAHDLDDQSKPHYVYLPVAHPDFVGLPFERVEAVAIKGKEIFVGTPRGLAMSRDAGASFKPLTLSYDHPFEEIKDVFFTHFNDRAWLFVATKRGLFVSDNKGRSFDRLSSREGLYGESINSLVVHATKSQLMVFAATDAGVFVSSNGGQSFSRSEMFNSSLCVYRLNVAVYGGKLLVFAATNDGLYFSNDEGKTFSRTWQDEDKTPVTSVSAAKEDGKLLVFAITPWKVLVSRNDDKGFTEVPGLKSHYDVTTHIHQGKVLIFAAERFGEILCSTDGGRTFDKIGDTHAINLSKLSIQDHHDGLQIAVGTDKGFMLLNNKGDLLIKTPFNFGFHEVYSIAAQNYDGRINLAAATSKGLFISRDGGKTFVMRNEEHGLNSHYLRQVVWHVHQGRLKLFAPSQQGVVISEDGGEHFWVANSKNGLVNEVLHQVVVTEYKNKLMVFALARDNLFISDDGGKNFRKVSINFGAATDFNAISLSKKDNQIMIFLATTSGLLVSKDEGESFQLIFDGSVSNVASLYSNEKLLVYLVSNNVLIKADDNGVIELESTFLSYRNIVYDLFNIVAYQNFKQPFLLLNTIKGMFIHYADADVIKPILLGRGLDGGINDVSIYDHEGVHKIFVATQSGLATNRAGFCSE